MEGPGPILSFLIQTNSEAAKQRDGKPTPIPVPSTKPSDQNHAELENLLYDPPTPVGSSSTMRPSYSYLTVNVDSSDGRTISTPQPFSSAKNRALERLDQTRLENAIVRDDKVRLFRLLENGCDPNPENLLARIIMCRHPLKAHRSFSQCQGTQQLNAITCMNATVYAKILIDYGARLFQTEVESFLLFQKKLEEKFAEAEYFGAPQKKAPIRDPGKLCFQKLATECKGIKNPFIEIVLKEVQDDVYFSDRERAICEFAALILPKLLNYSKSEKRDERKNGIE
jgi:hypothetical protein